MSGAGDHSDRERICSGEEQDKKENFDDGAEQAEKAESLDDVPSLEPLKFLKKNNGPEFVDSEGVPLKETRRSSLRGPDSPHSNKHVSFKIDGEESVVERLLGFILPKSIQKMDRSSIVLLSFIMLMLGVFLGNLRNMSADCQVARLSCTSLHHDITTRREQWCSNVQAFQKDNMKKDDLPKDLVEELRSKIKSLQVKLEACKCQSDSMKKEQRSMKPKETDEL